MDVGVIPNVTLFIQMALFLIFVFLVSVIFVKPYTLAIGERENITRDNYERAKKLRSEVEKINEEIERLLEEARSEVARIMEEAKKEANRIRAEIISKAEEKVNEEVSKSIEEIRRSLEEEKKKMDKAVKDIADEIVKRILGEVA